MDHSTMKATLEIDGAVLTRASQLTGVKDKALLVKMSLEALVQREFAAKLAALGGTQNTLPPVRRRRSL